MSGGLFDIERSRGKARLTQPRPSDIGAVPAGADRLANHDRAGRFTAGNRAGVGRSARTAIRAPLRAAEKRISEALATGGEPAESDRLLADALAVFHAVRRELGSSSALVQGPAIAYATETILAGYFVRAASEAGFLTERGMLLHDRALACEQAASRAMTAALAATKALSLRAPKQRNAALLAIEAAGENVPDDEPSSPAMPGESTESP